MMQKNQCPKCDQELEWEAGAYQCHSCDMIYKKIAFCPRCEAELDKLQACGAVNYFCNSCNEMKSKSTVRIEFQPQD